MPIPKWREAAREVLSRGALSENALAPLIPMAQPTLNRFLTGSRSANAEHVKVINSAIGKALGRNLVSVGTSVQESHVAKYLDAVFAAEYLGSTGQMTANDREDAADSISESLKLISAYLKPDYEAILEEQFASLSDSETLLLLVNLNVWIRKRIIETLSHSFPKTSNLDDIELIFQHHGITISAARKPREEVVQAILEDRFYMLLVSAISEGGSDRRRQMQLAFHVAKVVSDIRKVDKERADAMLKLARAEARLEGRDEILRLKNSAKKPKP